MKTPSLNMNLNNIGHPNPEDPISLNKIKSRKQRKSLMIKKSHSNIKGFKSDFKLFILIRSLIKIKKMDLRKIHYQPSKKIKKKKIEEVIIGKNLHEELIYQFDTYILCYEKKLPNSLSNKDRDSYFLSEIGLAKIAIKEENYFIEGGIKEVLRSYLEGEPLENTHYQNLTAPLIFDSNFEGGNLCLAFKVNN